MALLLDMVKKWRSQPDNANLISLLIFISLEIDFFYGLKTQKYLHSMTKLVGWLRHQVGSNGLCLSLFWSFVFFTELMIVWPNYHEYYQPCSPLVISGRLKDPYTVDTG